MKYNITLLPGDGIGPETVAQAKRVLLAIGEKFGHEFNFKEELIGGAAIDATGDPLPQETVDSCLSSQAVLLGSVGGPKWDDCPRRPEAALLGIRKAMNVYANLRPAKLYPSLTHFSPLKDEKIKNGVDIIIVRELTGGIYFGDRGYRNNKTFGREAYDTESYSELEIERVARIAYEIAEKRKHKLCLVDKANVLESSRLWRKIVTDINEDYPNVEVSEMFVDNAAMQLCLDPTQFDVIVTSNMFGDILSDLSAAIVGSIGLAPSASIGETGLGLYEAIHGSAPTLAGKNICNPAGTILSAALMLRHSLNAEKEASCIENAVASAISDGFGTQDISAMKQSTTEFTDEIISRIKS